MVVPAGTSPGHTQRLRRRPHQIAGVNRGGIGVVRLEVDIVCLVEIGRGHGVQGSKWQRKRQARSDAGRLFHAAGDRHARLFAGGFTGSRLLGFARTRNRLRLGLL